MALDMEWHSGYPKVGSSKSWSESSGKTNRCLHAVAPSTEKKEALLLIDAGAGSILIGALGG